MFIAALVVASLASPVAASEPKSAISQGKALIAANDCHGAIAVMQSAIPDAARLPDRVQRQQAMSAIHFYTAVAFDQCRLADKAREQIREFFRFRGGANKLDPAKFSRSFVDLFETVQKERDRFSLFDRLYATYSQDANLQQEQVSLALWGTTAAFQLLASDSERTRWGLLNEDIARAAFIQEFWKRRDPDPDDERNDYREEMERRIRFADRTFATASQERGAFTDRGRVYVLLGPPARAHRKGLQRGETTFVQRRIRVPLTGSLETWVYFRPQLLGAVPAQEVVFQFITQPEYGEQVMQREFLPLKALAEARRIHGRAE